MAFIQQERLGCRRPIVSDWKVGDLQVQLWTSGLLSLRSLREVPPDFPSPCGSGEVRSG